MQNEGEYTMETEPESQDVKFINWKDHDLNILKRKKKHKK